MRRVLIVDDEQPIRNLLGELLSFKGYQCTLAADVAAARDKLRMGRFELVISDFEMPGESGLDLLRHVRYRYPKTATIMISGSGDAKTKREALELGATTYIEKPFVLTEILYSVACAMCSQ